MTDEELREAYGDEPDDFLREWERDPVTGQWWYREGIRRDLTDDDWEPEEPGLARNTRRR
jgi:hypothetical protein